MKKLISLKEADLKMTYVLSSLIPILIGVTTMYLSYSTDRWIADTDFLTFFSIGCSLFGVFCLTISSVYVPYCYRIEVDKDNIYITKSETIITTKIEKTITVDKNKLETVSGSFLGFRSFYRNYQLYYLNFECETEFGKKVALLSKSPLSNRSFLASESY